MPHLDVSLLGPFRVTLDGRAVASFDTDKTRALLAYLVVEREREHRRAMLAGLLWPEVQEAAARHNLSQALFTLRRALGDKAPAKNRSGAPAKSGSRAPVKNHGGAAPPTSSRIPFLLATWQTLRFNPDSDVTVDMVAFQAGVSICSRLAPERMSSVDAQTLTEAVARYQGEFLSDSWSINSQAFEEWALLTRTHLHLLALDALECLTRYNILHGEFDLAVAHARRQIALEPLRELAHRQLMEALARDGRRPEALSHYAACKDLLDQELGIEPAPETQALFEMIRTAQMPYPPPYPGQQREQPGAEIRVPLPTFVGRGRELDLLDDALVSALAGRGQIRLITGDAGSGKTTLLEAFTWRTLTTRSDVLIGHGSGNAYTGLGDPYWPFIEMLQPLRATCQPELSYRPELGRRWQEKTPEEARRNNPMHSGSTLRHLQVQRLVTAGPTIMKILTEHAPALTKFINEEGMAPRVSSLKQSSLFAQITRVLPIIAARYPLVLLLDDLQWADQDSLNLLFHLGRRLHNQRVLIVGAFRSDVLKQSYSPQIYLHEQDLGQRHPLVKLIRELQRDWGDIQIDLAQVEGRAFTNALIDSEPNHLEAEFRETLYQHTRGHALFTTEMLRGMKTRGDLVRDAQGYWIADEQITWHTLPARVEAVIAEHIDQLLPAWQAILSLGSVEGSKFTVQVLAQGLNLPESEIIRQLSGPLSRHHHLITPVGVDFVGDQRLVRYRFRHLLFQKYLYNQLDPVERAQLHLTVGRTLETLYAEHILEISLPLARHFELGGERKKAITYLLEAGRRATHLAATEEALRLLKHGLKLLQHVEVTPEREQQETELQLALGAALRTKGWSLPERARAFERARALAQRTGTTEQLAQSMLYLTDVNLARGQLDQARAIGEQLLSMSTSTQNLAMADFGHYALGAVNFLKGNLLPARQHLEQITTLYLPQTNTRVHFIEANLNVRSRAWLGETLWALGYADQALVCVQQASANARDLAHAFPLGFALTIGELHVHQLRREPDALRATLRQLETLSPNVDQGILHLWMTIIRGWLTTVEDHNPAGLPPMQQIFDRGEITDTQGGSAYIYLLLAEAYLALGQVETAHTTLEHNLAHINETGLRFFEAETLRRQGEVLRKLNRPGDAETYFQRAVAVAQEQAARSWELRALMSLYKLRQAEGPQTELTTARQQLAEIYDWFTEGFDTPDLQEAAALLRQV